MKTPNRNRGENPDGWTPTFYGPDREERLKAHNKRVTEERERDEER